MSQKVTGPFSEELEIGAGWKVQWNAIDPNTGANVTGVVVSGAVVMAEAVGDEAGPPLETGPFMLVPGPNA